MTPSAPNLPACPTVPHSGVARHALKALGIAALFAPFAAGVFFWRTDAAGPDAIQAMALLVLLALPVFVLRRYRVLQQPEREHTLID